MWRIMMRDRLVELLDQNCGYVTEQKAETLADYLLAKGIIVPPCKVGDTVFEIDEHYTECTLFHERYSEYSCAGCDCSCDSVKEYYIRPVEITNIHWIFNMWDYYGKTWFTDINAAKKALEDMKNEKK